MPENVTQDLCEALCGLTMREWSALKLTLDRYFDERDPEYEAALRRRLQRTAPVSPDDLRAEVYERLTRAS